MESSRRSGTTKHYFYTPQTYPPLIYTSSSLHSIAIVDLFTPLAWGGVYLVYLIRYSDLLQDIQPVLLPNLSIPH